LLFFSKPPDPGAQVLSEEEYAKMKEEEALALQVLYTLPLFSP
jgi:hypothetical protein